MKILKIKVVNAPNFKENTAFELNNDHHVNKKSIGFGSDSEPNNKQLCHLVQLVFDLLNGKSINRHIIHEEMLSEISDDLFGLSENNCCKVQVRFSSKGVVYDLTTELTLINNYQEMNYIIKDEVLTYKDIETNKTLKIKRKTYEEGYVLVDDVSMVQFIGMIKPDLCMYQPRTLVLTHKTKYQHLSLINNLDPTLVNLEAPHIELIESNYNGWWSIKLKGQDEIHTAYHKGLGCYLSDKSIATLSMLSLVVDVLQNGGYLLVDTIEDYLSSELCKVVLEWFNCKTSNQHESVLIYTTHDSNYVMRDRLNYSIYKERGKIAFEKGLVKFNEQLNGKSVRLDKYLYKLSD